MADFEIPLAEPFTAAERGRYQPAWRDGQWHMEPAEHSWDGVQLRPGDTITALRISNPQPVISRNPGQEPDGRLILALPMRENDAKAATIGDYLIRLLRTVWHEQEGFSGKRPFGNSGWDCDLIRALVDGGFDCATFDEEGYYLQSANDERVDELIRLAIDAFGERS